MADVFVLSEAKISTLLLSDEEKFYPVHGYLSYLEDKENSLTIQDILLERSQERFLYAEEKIPNFGITGFTYWFHIAIINTETSSRHWWFEAQDPLADNLDTFLVREDGRIEHGVFGDHHSIKSREIRTRNPVLKIDLAAEESIDLYIKIKTYGSVTAPFYIWEPSAYPKQALDLQMEYGLYFGIIIALLVYNMMLFVSSRDSTYLYYCIFIAGYAFSQFCYNGLSYQYLWPDHGYINLPVVFIVTLIYQISMLQFTRAFMRVPKNFPRLNKFILVVMGLSVLPLVLTAFIDTSLGVRLNAGFVMCSMLLVLSVAVFSLYKGVREARYFLLAWVAFLLGMIVFQLAMMGILPASSFTLHGQQFGSAVEAILLSFALADRMRTLEEENKRISIEARTGLEQKVNEHTQGLNDALKSLAKANERLKENSFYDGLTGVRNRLYFDEYCIKEWLRCRRESSPITLLMIDIDHFKSINDNHGHLCGDYALRFLAGILKNNIKRPGDIIARYGGEEFVIILPNTTIEGGAILAEEIRSELESKAFEFHDALIKLTASVGCAVDYPTKTDRDPSHLINAADKAMYVAKREGRNLVKIA